jgi:hypothetical protein
LFFGSKSCKEAAPYDIVTAHTHTVYPQTTALDAVVERMDIFKSRYVKSVFGRSPAAAVWFQTLEPAWRNTKERKTVDDVWHVHHRLLAIVPKDADALPARLRKNDCDFVTRTTARYTDITRTTLVPIVGRLVQYPAYLMSARLVRETARILNALHESPTMSKRGRRGRSMHEWYGRFRGPARCLWEDPLHVK